ncbi:MAG TPA: M28 family peptidase [Propionibacteriaceae bacterium]|nr:M28 family peptidase [Propionibacteriaceae bacterium]
MRRAAAATALMLALAGCTSSSPGSGLGGEPVPADSSPFATRPPQPEAPPPGRTASTGAPSGRSSTAPPVRFDSAAVIRDIRRLAEQIGPREATSPGFARAADLVEDRLERLGYRVRRTRVMVPAGSSWGTPVRRGTSENVIGEPLGFDARRPHVVVGAHLDTVAVSPGAEDNASGVAVTLELARLAAVAAPGLPAQFVAFGAEEPRGSGDALHHFGSRQLVADLPSASRRAIQAMVSLDRVGVAADHVPVCTGGPRGAPVRDALRRAARKVSVPSRRCFNRSSDHWSYEKAGVPAARIGSIPYRGYHSRHDVVSVVDRQQLGWVGEVVWLWLQGLS